MDATTAARVTSCEVLERFLASYWTTRTRANYRFILTRWLDWCHDHGYDPVGGADAAALEAFIAELKTAGYAPNTIVGRISAISAFYRWCVREQLVNRNPVELIRRPARPMESSTASLTRHQLTDWLAAAEVRGGAWWATAMLLGLNGLRCGELIACNVEDLGNHSWHHPEADHHQGRPAHRGRARATHHAGSRRRHRRSGPRPAADQPGRPADDRLQRAIPCRRARA
jgi:site-specific recombinase XerD